MNVLQTIIAAVFMLVLGVFFLVLGFMALIAPQKIVDFNLRFIPKEGRVAFFNKMRLKYIEKAEGGAFAASLRQSGLAIILVGFVVMYALINGLVL